jgi:hypothetical protein
VEFHVSARTSIGLTYFGSERGGSKRQSFGILMPSMRGHVSRIQYQQFGACVAVNVTHRRYPPQRTGACLARRAVIWAAIRARYDVTPIWGLLPWACSLLGVQIHRGGFRPGYRSSGRTSSVCTKTSSPAPTALTARLNIDGITATPNTLTQSRQRTGLKINDDLGDQRRSPARRRWR